MRASLREVALAAALAAPSIRGFFSSGVFGGGGAVRRMDVAPGDSPAPRRPGYRKPQRHPAASQTRNTRLSASRSLRSYLYRIMTLCPICELRPFSEPAFSLPRDRRTDPHEYQPSPADYTLQPQICPRFRASPCSGHKPPQNSSDPHGCGRRHGRPALTSSRPPVTTSSGFCSWASAGSAGRCSTVLRSLTPIRP